MKGLCWAVLACFSFPTPQWPEIDECNFKVTLRQQRHYFFYSTPQTEGEDDAFSSTQPL